MEKIKEKFKKNATIMAFSVHAEIYEYVFMKICSFLTVMHARPELMGFAGMTPEEMQQMKVTQAPNAPEGYVDITLRLTDLFNQGYALRNDNWSDVGEWWNEVSPFVPYLWY